MEITKPLAVMGIEVTTYHDISRVLENMCLPILDDTASTTEQDDEYGKQEKYESSTM